MNVWKSIEQRFVSSGKQKDEKVRHTEGQHSQWQNSSLKKNAAEEDSGKNSDLICDCLCGFCRTDKEQSHDGLSGRID